MADLIRSYLGSAYSTALGTSEVEPFMTGSLSYDETRSGFLVCNSHASNTISIYTRSGSNAMWVVAAGETKFIPHPGSQAGGAANGKLYAKASAGSTTWWIQQVIVGQ